MTLRVKRIAVSKYIIMWHHPSYYKRLAEIRREEERKEKEKNTKKALTSVVKSDSIKEQGKESISDCLE